MSTLTSTDLHKLKMAAKKTLQTCVSEFLQRHAMSLDEDFKVRQNPYAPVTLSRIHWRSSTNAGDMCNTDVSANHGE